MFMGKKRRTCKILNSMAAVAALCVCMSAASVVRAAGFQNITISVSVNAPPTVSAVSSPAPAQMFGTATVVVTGTASTANGVVSAVQVSVDGGAWQNAANTGVNYSTWSYNTGVLADGPHTVACKAFDQYDGVETPGSPVNFTTDNSPPAAVVTVNDGTGADIDTDTSLSTLSANWSGSSDPGTGIIRYWYGIGTAAGGTNIVGWTDNAMSTSVTRGGLSLTLGWTYYFTVKAENGAGLLSGVTNSDGLTVISLTTTLSAAMNVVSVTAPVGYPGSAGDPAPGSIVYYELEFTNAGLTGALTTVLDDNIPANTTYVPGSIERCFSGGVACALAPDPDTAAGSDCYYITGPTASIHCDIGNLGVGDSGRIRFKVIIN
jgi:uncharacterized repeat protein (TIGR01451 family)